MKLLLEDVRLAVRLILKTPRFVAVCVFSLVLGIGINSLIFNLVDATLLRPFPFKEAERVVRILVVRGSPDRDRITLKDLDFLREHARTIGRVAGTEPGWLFIRDEEGAEMTVGRSVTSDYFSMLDLQPRLGRFLAETEGITSPIVISYNLWQRRFGQDPNIIGRRIQLIDRVATIVGVAPAGFYGTERIISSDAWWPIETWHVWTNRPMRQQPYLALIAVLQEGVSIEQCKAELEVLAASLPGTDADPQRRVRFNIIPEREYTGLGKEGKDGKLATILLALSIIVLLIACINISALFSSRFEDRRREFAIRIALGATRLRLARQLLIEGLVLSLFSAGICLLIGIWAVDAVALILPKLPFSLDLGLRTDHRVIAFTLFIALFATLAFGLGPTLRFSKSALCSVMTDSRRGGPVAGSLFGRSAVLTGQIGVSLALLALTAVLIAGSLRALHLDLGFAQRDLLLTTVNFPAEDRDRELAVSRLLDLVRAVPGVRAAELATHVPCDSFLGARPETVFMPSDQPGDPGVSARSSLVGESYFKMLQIAVHQGRTFTSADDRPDSRVAVVSQRMANRFWPGSNPIGQQMYLADRNALPFEVIGVVNDVSEVSGRADQPAFYLHLCHGSGHRTLTLMLDAPEGLGPQIRRAIRGIHPEMVIMNTASLGDNIKARLSPNRIAAALLGVFGGLALVLSSIGLFGVVSYIVKQRTQEIGIRLAIGAQPQQILRLTMRRGFVVSVVGSLLGIALAYPFVRGLGGNMFYVGDESAVLPCAIATAVLLLVVLLASYFPARRATRLDPLVALRCE